jgi:hypothetical protein
MIIILIMIMMIIIIIIIIPDFLANYYDNNSYYNIKPIIISININNKHVPFYRDTYLLVGARSTVIYIYKRLSSVRQEVFTHRHDRHQTSVSKAVARVVVVRWCYCY